MDLLKREMERKKKALQDAKAKTKGRGGSGSTRSRFIKASELRRLMEEDEDAEAERINLQEEKEKHDIDIQIDISNDKKRLREEHYSHEEVKVSAGKSKRQGDDTHVDSETRDADFETKGQQQHADTEPDNEPSQKKKRTTSAARIKKGTGTTISDTTTTTNRTANQQSKSKSLEQVKRELRSFGLPISLFGEVSLSDRVKRLEAAQRQKAVVQLHESEADEFRLGQGHGIRNPFLEKEELVSLNGAAAAAAAADLVPQKLAGDSKASGTKVTDTEKRDDNNNDDGGDPDPHKRVYRHFKGLLKQWEADLNERSDDVKRSLAGRNETKTVKQCKDYIRPLFQLCKRRQLEDGLLNKLLQMVEFCEQGEFVRAHDAYLDVAIGRAAWPIGVTMVGIHARTGRAKIESSNVAHVMNSELQRKYLTSVKRLLTYEQNMRTDVDPSKKVLN